MEEPKVRIKRLMDIASSITVSPHVKPHMYFRSGFELIRMAGVYSDEHNLESAFILYSKFIILMVERLPGHPQYNLLTSADRKDVRKKAKLVLELLDHLKPKLLALFTEDHEKWLRHQKELDEERERLAAETALLVQKEAECRSSQLEAERLELLRKQEEQLAQMKELEAQKAASMVPVPNSSSSWIPPVDRSNKPAHLIGDTFAISQELRCINIPSCLVPDFIQLAEDNSRNNIETCAVLCGRLACNSFTITHLVLPKQSGTSDSCQTRNEEELFVVLERDNLITLGWIHTHPSQTSFMSSIDVHTHFGYQVMLPEAIAIVVSCKYSQVLTFSLTAEHGIAYLSQCTETGFHKHPTEPPIYEESRHTKTSSSLSVNVVDLRYT